MNAGSALRTHVSDVCDQPAVRPAPLIEKRDYPVVFATLWIFSLLGLVVNLVSDFVYTLVDPRIDFESREV